MMPTLEEMLRAACVLEATARKAGNVHPEASFADLKYQDFVDSAKVAAPILARTCELGVGRAILEAVAATKNVTPSNTNLGIILLLAPLAAVQRQTLLSAGIGDVLKGLTLDDAQWAYQAIRMAQPGGMGQVDNEDISRSPTTTLREAMCLAAERDLVARQYADNFSIVLEFGLPYMKQVGDFALHWETAIIGLQLELLARYPDSLIVRKCGRQTAGEVSRRAAAVLKAGAPGTQRANIELERFDIWLRADGNRRNPGTTADLIAAILFAAFRDGGLPVILPPVP
jgi:triphosphoribosyl-dephospho-CoA synthase